MPRRGGGYGDRPIELTRAHLPGTEKNTAGSRDYGTSGLSLPEEAAPAAPGISAGPCKKRGPLHAPLKRPDEFPHELIPGVLIKIEYGEERVQVLKLDKEQPAVAEPAGVNALYAMADGVPADKGFNPRAHCRARLYLLALR